MGDGAGLAEARADERDEGSAAALVLNHAAERAHVRVHRDADFGIVATDEGIADRFDRGIDPRLAFQGRGDILGGGAGQEKLNRAGRLYDGYNKGPVGGLKFFKGARSMRPRNG